MPLDEFQQMTLQECMQRPGCPLCRAVWRMDAARFSWYVNDGVLDEETLRDVVGALGFCPPHALYLSLIEGNSFLWSHLGTCMVYVDVIQQALLPDLEGFLTRSNSWLLHPFKRQVFAPLRHLFHHALCPLCFDHRQHETIYREQFAKAFATSAGFRQAYRQADSLCFPHFQQICSSLTEERVIRMLDVAAFHALKQCEQTPASTGQDQLRKALCLLFGAETFLWSDFTPRAALNASQIGPPSCLACQKQEQEAAQVSTALLENVSCRGGDGEQEALCLCSWHAWEVFHQSRLQPATLPQLESVVRRTCRIVLNQLRNTRLEQQTCHMCGWNSEQETLHVGTLKPQLADTEQQVQLCLSHARALLRQSDDEETVRNVALASLRSIAPLGKRLEAYVYKCTERFQDQMQPDELVAWFDAIRWFGGSESARFLLTSSPTTDTARE